LGLFKNNIHSIKKISINEAHDNNTYCFIKALGYGGFGKVFLAKEKYPNCLVAIKQLLNSSQVRAGRYNSRNRNCFQFENPNVVTYYHHFMKRMFYFSNGILLRRQFKR
jgi:serine/threonine protein kinase